MTDKVGFMESPLVTWVQTFREEPLEYVELSDGVFLNDIMIQIDSRSHKDLSLMVNRTVEDVQQRLQNWDILLRAIKSYYQDVLQQLIVMKMPNIIQICKEPEKGSTEMEVEKALLLILGCAIQSERKEEFIYTITNLDIEVQTAIMQHIQEITDNAENIFYLEDPEEQLEPVSRNMYHHIQRLIAQRDSYLLDLTQAALEMDDVQSQLNTSRKLSVSSPGSDKHHVGVELAECKAKLRRLRAEVEEKTETVTELKDELSDVQSDLAKLREENLQLTQDARSARAYRDELDVLREKVSRVDKHEAEISRYKEKLNELEFFKTRVEELREDNLILVESKTMLEEQLKASRKRAETVIELENELMKCKQQLETATEFRDHDRRKIQDLTEENKRLEYEMKSSLNESANLGKEISEIRSKVGTPSSSLNDQINETADAKIHRLELENQQLQSLLDELKENSLLENNSRLLELEKENHRLSKKVEKLQETSSKETQQYIQLEELTQKMTREKEQMERTIETIRESSERQVKEMERENEQLNQTLEILRERNEKTQDMKMQALERENKEMHDSVQAMKSQVSNLEYSNKQLKNNCDKLALSSDKVLELEDSNRKLDKVNRDLRKEVTTLSLTCDKYDKLEQELSDLQVENRKLAKAVDGTKVLEKKLESLEHDNINLTVENQRLQKSIGVNKDSLTKIFELETEKDEKSKEIQQLKKCIDTLKSNQERHSKLEVDLLDAKNTNQKLQKSLEATVKKVEVCERENRELDNENQKLLKTIETLKVSARRVDELEKEVNESEVENGNLNREKSSLEKENKRLKKALEVKESSLDDSNVKVTQLEREVRALRKVVEKSDEKGAKVKELEKENKEFIQRSQTDKKTLATLREELVNEKIKTQHLNNELEKLNQELDKIGLNKEKLVAAELAEDESRYKALENMLESELKKSLEMKEEKISALEARLDESKSRNVKLQEELKAIKLEYEAFKQRHEEEKLQPEVAVKESQRHVTTLLHTVTASPTKDLMEFKDHLIVVERKNATLEAENKNLKTQSGKLQTRLEQIEARNTTLQSQMNQVQTEKNTLQSENAKLQVEKTTLQSQTTSTLQQNSQLQQQYSGLETEHERLLVNHEELQSAQELLVSDHEALQQLHEQLTSEYDQLMSEHGALKTSHKTLRTEYQELTKQQEKLGLDRHSIDKMRRDVLKEQEAIQKESQSAAHLQAELNQLKNDKARLLSTNEKLSEDNKTIMTDYRQVKTECNTLKLEQVQLQGDVAEYKQQINTMDVEVSKMANRNEALSQLNSKLEDENRQLILQLQTLLQQNQELLTKAMENKDTFHEEERVYMEKLSDLRRQKEKLEEKIMDQYKNYDPSPNKKNKSFGFNIVRKAKGFINRRSLRKRRKTIVTFMPAELAAIQEERQKDREKYRSTPNLADTGSANSPDTSSLGSYGDGTDEHNTPLTRKKEGDISESPKSFATNLSKHHRQLASSTTALNMFKLHSPQGFKLRGARSSEDILSDYSPRPPTKSADTISAGSAGSYTAVAVGYNHSPYFTDRRQSSGSNFSGGAGRHGSMSSEDSGQVARDAVTGKHSTDLPYNGGQHTPKSSPRHTNQPSPGSEEISLEQFLRENNKTPPVPADAKHSSVEVGRRPLSVYDPTARIGPGRLSDLPKSTNALNNYNPDVEYNSPKGSGSSIAKTSTPKPHTPQGTFTIRSFADRQKAGSGEPFATRVATPPPIEARSSRGGGDAVVMLARAPRTGSVSESPYDSQTVPRRNKPSPREFTPPRSTKPSVDETDTPRTASVSQLVQSFQSNSDSTMLNNQAPMVPPRRKDASSLLRKDGATKSMTSLNRPQSTSNDQDNAIQGNGSQQKKEGENSTWFEYGCV